MTKLIQSLLAVLCVVLALFIVIYAPGFRKIYSAGFFLLLAVVLFRLAGRSGTGSGRSD